MGVVDPDGKLDVEVDAGNAVVGWEGEAVDGDGVRAGLEASGSIEAVLGVSELERGGGCIAVGVDCEEKSKTRAEGVLAADMVRV